MARYRRKRSGIRTSASVGGNTGMMSGVMMVIFGVVLLIADLIMYGIAVDQLDTAITTASTYSANMPGLASIMPLWGMILFLIFMALGIGSLVGGTAMSIRAQWGSGWMGMLMLAIMGGIVIIVSLVGNGLVVSQLETAIETTNQTTNTMTGAVDIMGVFGMVLFLALMLPGVAMLGGAVYGGYRGVRDAFGR